MKTFSDLKFEPHPNLPGIRAQLDFPNGYGVSVIAGEPFYTDPERPYEVAVWKGDDLTYDTPITSDVIGYCTPEAVTDIMKKIQDLEPTP